MPSYLHPFLVITVMVYTGIIAKKLDCSKRILVGHCSIFRTGIQHFRCYQMLSNNCFCLNLAKWHADKFLLAVVASSIPVMPWLFVVLSPFMVIQLHWALITSAVGGPLNIVILFHFYLNLASSSPHWLKQPKNFIK